MRNFVMTMTACVCVCPLAQAREFSPTEAAGVPTLGSVRHTLLVHPDEFTETWIDRAAALGIDGLFMHPVGGTNAVQSLNGLLKDLENPAFRARIDRAMANGIEVGYEFHAASWLLPRDLFKAHPEYFRMDRTGKRTAKLNFCFSNKEALDIVARRAAELAGRLYGSRHRYFFWLDDVNGGGCACEKCRRLSESDQQLLYVNRIATELRKAIPDATFCYLAYYGTITPPRTIRPVPGVFLEYAPYRRDMKTAIALQCQTQLKPLERLFGIFGKKDARLLEYWYDNSLFSKYRKPPQRLTSDADLVHSDLAAYRALGFRDIACFACYLGDDYEKLWNKPDVASFQRGFHSSVGGRDGTDFTWSLADGRFRFGFDVADESVAAIANVTDKRDLERGDRVEVFFSPTAALTNWYYCAEIDPKGRVLDYRAVFPRQFDYSWKFRTLECRCAATARGYRVEGSVGLDELNALGIDPEDFHMGAFRADYDRSEKLVAWQSLLPPGPGEADFHRPCMMFRARSKTAPLKIAVYADKGPRGIGAVEWVRLVNSSPEMSLTLVDGADVAAGKLAGQDALVMPGGRSIGEFKSLGPKGVARMKDFIRDGGAYFGTCAGCCLLMCAPSNRTCVIPWNTRGSEDALLFPNVTLNETGAKALGLKAGDHVMRYHGGPLLRPVTNVIEGAKFELWGTMNAEATMKGRLNPKKEMHGAAAVVGGTYGKGRVFVTSLHPEYFDGSLYIVEAAFKWLTGRKVSFPAKRRIPGMTAVGFLNGFLSRTAAETALAIDAEPDYDLVAINDSSIWKNALRHLDVVVISGGIDRKSKRYASLEAYLQNGGRVICYGNDPMRLSAPPGAVRCTAAEVVPSLRQAFPKR